MPVAAKSKTRNNLKPRGKTNKESFHPYFKKMIKVIFHNPNQPNTQPQLSAESVQVMDSFMEDIFTRLATQAGQLARGQNSRNSHKTLTERDIHYALQLILPPDLFRYASEFGTRAVRRWKHGDPCNPAPNIPNSSLGSLGSSNSDYDAFSSNLNHHSSPLEGMGPRRSAAHLSSTDDDLISSLETQTNRPTLQSRYLHITGDEADDSSS